MDIETLLHIKKMLDENESTFPVRFYSLLAENETLIDEFKDASNFDFNVVEDGKE